MENEEQRLKNHWQDKSWKFLKNIEEIFIKHTGRPVSDCQIQVNEHEISFFWKNDLNCPWLSLLINDISSTGIYGYLYEEFRKIWRFPAFPWGSLQGVRPTKLVHQKMNQGFSNQSCEDFLMKKYGVEEKRAKLLVDIADTQKKILKNQEESIGLYIGIPFCPNRCFYCSFPGEVIPKNEGEIFEFWHFLKRDIQAASEWVKENDRKISSLYIGGGTPTSLPLALFQEMFEIVQDQFDLSSLFEFSLEAGRPETLSTDKLKAAYSAGVNRISVNPQSMHQKTLDAIGRNHRVEDILIGVNRVREIGFPILNMDLIAGLPGESVEDFLHSVRSIIELRPENITVHSLALKKGSHWQDQNKEMPSADTMKEMIEKGREEIIKNGWHPYYLYRQKNSPGRLENIGYGLKNTESLYNIQMMEETHLIIAMGPGSATKKPVGHGKINNYHFPKNRKSYQENIEKHLLCRKQLLEDRFE